ncbi:hypothetical protein F4803DRAFT_542936 [Xylaria telfairii]|nr:hypothetical protein F4803DRAFT_542936 [Xylaria telfairii]
MNEDQWGRGDDKSKNGSNDSTSGQNVTAKYALATVDIGDDYNHGENSNLNSPNDSYLVFPRDKTIDGILSGQLRAIGQTLNFIVRAQASGIEVGDFDSLAAVKPEQWAELVEGPDYAADVVVKSLLDLSMWDICILSEHSKTLRKEMEELGVVI